MENIRNHIYLAAMLHDIGKFYQRADTGSVASSVYLSTIGKNERDFCPQFNGIYSHKHVLWTAQFIDDFSSVFNNLLGSNDHDLSNRDNLMNLAASHHLPKESLTRLGRIIKDADCLSSGMDRDSEISMKDDQDERSWDSFKKKRMISILETINGNKPKDSWCHIPVVSMALKEGNFPQRNFKREPDYKALWEKFIGEFKFIQANTYHAFSETLLNLLYKYTTAIPSSTVNFPDISLYDHLKTTAALAICLYDVENSGEKPKDKFLLIGADFSGIQSYIYQIVSKYAGKNLKGRSFYLRILSDAVVRYILKELDLFQANIIYNSGGGFYILAPNTSSVRIKISDAVKTIEEKLFATHKTSLYAAIDYVTLSEDVLMHRDGQNLSQKWGELFEKRDKKKRSRYAQIIKDNYNEFFNPILIGGETKRDCITGEEFSADEMAYSEGDLKPLKKVNKQQIVLGKKLRNYEVMVVSDGPVPYWADKDPIEPIGLGLHYYFLMRDDLTKMKEELRASADKVTVVTPNGEHGNCDFMGRVDGINNIYALDFYGGNEIIGNNPPTFEELCDKVDGAFKRLGVLRMDVDNLGNIFQSGIDPARATITRYAALSRSFDYFFSGYLNTIWEDVSPKKSLIIYSGGDDVFIVGSWEVTIELAKHIREDFAKYTCDNPFFGISGGIVLVPAKFPIMKAASLSGDEEQEAKQHHVGQKDKNSISILGIPLNWDTEFDAVESLKEDIVNLKIDDQIAKSFISKVMTHCMNADLKNHKITQYKTYWMVTYDMSRMKGRVKDEAAKALITNFINDICKSKGSLNGQEIVSDYHALELWALACRWAELEIRTYKL